MPAEKKGIFFYKAKSTYKILFCEYFTWNLLFIRNIFMFIIPIKNSIESQKSNCCFPITDQSDNEGENGGDNDNANNSQSENQDIPAPSSPERSKAGG